MLWRNLRFGKSQAFEWATDCRIDSRNSLGAYFLVTRFVQLMSSTKKEIGKLLTNLNIF